MPDLRRRLLDASAHLITDEPAPYLPISANSSGLAPSFALSAAEEAHLEELEDSEEVFESRLYDESVTQRMDDSALDSETSKP